MFEASVKFAAAVAVADYLACPNFEPARFAVLLRPIFGKPPAFGDWLTLVHDVLACSKVPGQPFDSAGSGLVVPELYRFTFSTGRKASDPPSAEFNQLASIVQWRNDHLGHGALGMNPQFIADDLGHQLDRLTEVLGGLWFLSDYRLVSESWTGAMAEWTGPRIPLAALTGAPSVPR